MGWKVLMIGQALHDERKWTFVEALFDGRWPSWNCYEKSLQLWKDCGKAPGRGKIEEEDERRKGDVGAMASRSVGGDGPEEIGR